MKALRLGIGLEVADMCRTETSLVLNEPLRDMLEPEHAMHELECNHRAGTIAEC